MSFPSEFSWRQRQQRRRGKAATHASDQEQWRSISLSTDYVAN